jgi:hypothetical protein
MRHQTCRRIIHPPDDGVIGLAFAMADAWGSALAVRIRCRQFTVQHFHHCSFVVP